MSTSTSSISTSSFDSRPTFIATSAMSPKDAKDFFAKIEQINQQLEAVENTAEKTATFVYSCEALSNKVQDEYSQWLKQIEPLKSILARCETAISQRYEEVPFIEPPNDIARAMQEIEKLCLKLLFLRGHEDLKQILQSPVNREAHQLCRDTITACEAISTSKELILQRVAALQKLFDAAKEKIEIHRANLNSVQDQFVCSHANALHIEMIAFIKNTLEKIVPNNPDDRDLAPFYYSLNALSDVLCDKKPISKAQALSQKEKGFFAIQDTTFKGNAKKIDLPKECCFRQASGWFSGWLSSIKYSGIHPIANKVQKEEATELRYMQLEIQKRAQTICQGSTVPGMSFATIQTESSFYKQKLLSCTENLRQAYKELSEKNGAVHAGLYYVNGRRAHAEEMKKQVEYFEKLTDPQNSNVFNVQQKVFTYVKGLNLTPQTYGNVIDNINNLFQAANALATLQPPEPLIEDPVRQFAIQAFESQQEIVAQVAKKMWQACKKFSIRVSNEQIWDMVIQHNRAAYAFYIIKEYLFREMTRWLYFSKEPSNHKLDLILFNVSTIFKSDYERLLNDPAFARVSTAYASASQIVALPPHEAAIFSRILFDLSFTHLVSPISDIVSYAQSSLTMQEHVFSPSFAKLVDIVITKLEERQKKNEGYPTLGPQIGAIDSLNTNMQQDSQKLFTQLLFTHLTHALWGKDSSKQQATTALQSFFASLTGAEPILRQIGQVSHLLYNFVFTCCLQPEKNKLSTYEKSLYDILLKQYVTVPTLCNDLRNVHGMLPCERLLYRACVGSENQVDLQWAQYVQQHRGAKGFENWKKTMAIYETCENMKTGKTVDSTQIQFLKNSTSLMEAQALAMSSRANLPDHVVSIEQAYREVDEACLRYIQDTEFGLKPSVVLNN